MALEANRGLVSVIVPTHNRSTMLERALMSIVRQDHENLEIIVIADNCTDDTKKVVEAIADPRIIYVPLVKNAGGAQARNFGLDLANGEFIAFLDDDDEWYDGKLTRQIQLLQSHPDAALVSCNFDRFDGERDIPSNLPEVITVDDLFYLNICGSFSFCMTKREYVRDLRINPVLKSHQDWDLWLKILLATGLQCRVVPGRLVRYYDNHPDKLSNKHYQTFLSKVVFLRSYWARMTPEHRNYQLYELLKWKRLYFYDRSSHVFQLRLYLKALWFYHKSRHDQNIHNYLLLLPKLFPVKRGLRPTTTHCAATLKERTT
ncbi:MAG: glycosyltransferase family 2 protein [bacterium]